MNLQPRMIYTEGKAKVVAAAWGKEFIQIPCRASYLAPGIIHPFLHNILVQFILFFIPSWCKELTTFYPPNTSDDLCLLFCILYNFLLWILLYLPLWLWEPRGCGPTPPAYLGHGALFGLLSRDILTRLQPNSRWVTSCIKNNSR